MNKRNVKRIQVFRSTERSSEIVKFSLNNDIDTGVGCIGGTDPVFNPNYSYDITDSIYHEMRKSIGDSHLSDESKLTTETMGNKVFIVHGHDHALKNDVARFVESMRLDCIILHEQTGASLTVIEKFEKYAADVGFAIILYTPCDKGKKADGRRFENRARQNVVFEHGFFIHKLTRQRVVALLEPSVIKPSDMDGSLFTPADSFGAWKGRLYHELKEIYPDIQFPKI